MDYLSTGRVKIEVVPIFDDGSFYYKVLVSEAEVTTYDCSSPEFRVTFVVRDIFHFDAIEDAFSWLEATCSERD